MLCEEEVKKIIADKLESELWDVTVAWGHRHGADILATKENRKWVIEVKGPGSRPPMRYNYFISVLGELLQRMEDAAGKYSVAFPDMAPYRKLWSDLPDLAKKRTGITLLLVDENGQIEELH